MQINTVKFIGEFGGYRNSNHYFTKSSMDNNEELQGGGGIRFIAERNVCF